MWCPVCTAAKGLDTSSKDCSFTAGCALQKGQLEVMIDSLPGFPDGVSLAEDGNFWIALTAPDQAFVKILPYRCVSCSLQCWSTYMFFLQSLPLGTAFLENLHPGSVNCFQLPQHSSTSR